MKKISTVFLVTAMLALSASAAVSPSSTNPAKRSIIIEEIKVERGVRSVDIPMAFTPKPTGIQFVNKPIDLLSLTPKEFEIATGQKLNFFQKIKFNIGKKIAKKSMASGGKSKTTAALLAFFLGGLGIHRFYLGYTWQGVVQLLTLGGLGIWALIDFVRILTGDLQPKDGEYE